MRWRELVSAVARRSGVEPQQAQAVLEAFVEEIVGALGRGGEVVIPGVVKIASRWQEARVVRSIREGRRVSVDGRYVPRIHAGARLQRVLVARTHQTWRDPAHQAAWLLAEALIGDLELYHRGRVPTDLEPSMAPTEIEARCAASLGEAWELARDTFDSAVAEPVRRQQRHLSCTARRRWGRP